MSRGAARIAGVGAAAVSLLAAGAAARELDMARVRLRCPEVFVESYPMVVAVTIEYRSRYIMREQTLASTWLEGVCLNFRLTRADGESLGVGVGGFGHPTAHVSRRGKFFLDAGEAVSLVFDLGQLGPALSPNRTTRWPSAGEWSVFVRHTLSHVPSESHKVTVRPPTEEEQDFVRRLKLRQFGPRDFKWGAKQSWFPDVILDEGGVPDASRLPIETRRVAELIRILRATARSPGDGLDAMSRIDIEWGYLRPLIDSLRYECLLAGGREKEASALRETAQGGSEDAAGHFAAVDKGAGLLAKIEELKKKNAARESRAKAKGGNAGDGRAIVGLITAGVAAVGLCAGVVTWVLARSRGRGAPFSS